MRVVEWQVSGFKRLHPVRGQAQPKTLPDSRLNPRSQQLQWIILRLQQGVRVQRLGKALTPLAVFISQGAVEVGVARKLQQCYR